MSYPGIPEGKYLTSIQYVGMENSCSQVIVPMKKAAFNYPLFINLENRLVVIVGAGEVGRRKLAGLLQIGAQVRLIDPRMSEEITNLPGVETLKRNFGVGDLANSVLVFACTDSPEVNRLVVKEAQRRKIFCSSVDNPDRGDFILPAILRRGPLTLAISTAGGSPALAAQIRDRLAEEVHDSWGIAVEIIAAVRRKWLTEEVGDQYNQQILRSFWERKLIPAIEKNDHQTIDRLLRETFGEAFSLASLKIRLPEGMP